MPFAITGDSLLCHTAACIWLIPAPVQMGTVIQGIPKHFPCHWVSREALISTALLVFPPSFISKSTSCFLSVTIRIWLWNNPGLVDPIPRLECFILPRSIDLYWETNVHLPCCLRPRMHSLIKKKKPKNKWKKNQKQTNKKTPVRF